VVAAGAGESSRALVTAYNPDNLWQVSSMGMTWNDDFFKYPARVWMVESKVKSNPQKICK
jgi:hypothetical protein